MRILFSFIGGSGHLHPLVPVARAAEAAGHTVAVAGSGRMGPKITAAGFTALATSETRPGAPLEQIPLVETDPEQDTHDFRENFLRRGARRHAEAISRLGRDWRADVVVREELDFGAAIAAERLGLPCATVLVLAAGSFPPRKILFEPLRELRAAYDLPPDPELATLHRDLVLSPFPPSFRSPEVPLPEHTFSFRPAAALPPAVTDRPPTVYFTLGTVFSIGAGDLFARVLAGLRDLPARVIATVGEYTDPADFGPQPEHIRLARFIPQAELLPRVDLVVSHGGSGSVLGALAHGLPSVLLPLGADQPHNARRALALDAARVLDPLTATPAEIRTTIAAALTDPTLRAGARRLQAELDTLPAPEATIPLLEHLTPVRS